MEDKYFYGSEYQFELFIGTKLEEESDSKDSQPEIKNENYLVTASLVSILSISVLFLFSMKNIIYKKQLNYEK